METKEAALDSVSRLVASEGGYDMLVGMRVVVGESVSSRDVRSSNPKQTALLTNEKDLTMRTSQKNENQRNRCRLSQRKTQSTIRTAPRIKSGTTLPSSHVFNLAHLSAVWQSRYGHEEPTGHHHHKGPQCVLDA